MSMTKEEVSKLAELLVEMFAAFPSWGKDMLPRVKVYAKNLQDLPLPAIEKAITYLLRTHDKDVAPSIAAIIRIAREQMRIDHDNRAWNRLEQQRITDAALLLEEARERGTDAE